MNSLADSSMEEVKAAIRSEPWLAAHFDIGETYIRTKSGRIKYVFSGLDRNIVSIKRSEEHTSELQSLMRISYAVFCLKKKNKHHNKVIDNKYNEIKENTIQK